MRLNVPSLVLASSVAISLASPPVANEPHANPNMSFLEQNRLTVEQLPPSCNLAACVGLSGTITCVLSAISIGDPGALQRCISNGLVQICSCAACVPAVSNFLMSLGVCVTSPTPPNGNDTFDSAWVSAVMMSFRTSASAVHPSSPASTSRLGPMSASKYSVAGPVVTSHNSV